MPRHHQPIRHTPYQPSIPCGRKRRFKTEAEALAAIDHATLLDIKLELKAYQCPYCGAWHLSSVK